jgi:hypothetical protein
VYSPTAKQGWNLGSGIELTTAKLAPCRDRIAATSTLVSITTLILPGALQNRRPFSNQFHLLLSLACTSKLAG